ncbi:cilia- and flagella-associated protein HOATZ isoform X2 [Antechinus flavipes]|uniref:cilia- and flagella-associated protein HOATZ isoform X2 n=1 Tax=Antechinus flavipes TaxID=38775 RepID=UPI00223663C0|nr:cilia- and flagella-associated protein HOATZ isoform X2 [Antechinus flavipes]
METSQGERETDSRDPIESIYPGPLVFTGSSEEDVALAKQFWVSATMHPHPESQLVSSGTQQRLPVARTTGPTVAERNLNTEDFKTEQLFEKTRKAQETEEKEKYLQKAKKREEILDLLRKQREERIEKELVSLVHKPKVQVPPKKKVLIKSERMDQEEVKIVSQLN